MNSRRLDLARDQILSHRLRASALDERLPHGQSSLELAAWAGLPDSMPRAALLSIHARVAGTQSSTWEDPAFVQLWGPRYGVYVVAARDRAVFSLGRLPDSRVGRARAEGLATRLAELLGERRMRYDDAGAALGVHPNALRYAATTGTVMLRWEGARRPVVWTAPRPTIEPGEARMELARRYLRVLGPATPDSFAKWAGIAGAEARRAFAGLEAELTTVRTPIGDGAILAADEESFRIRRARAAGPRLLPSGDTYYLLHGADRALLVPDQACREELWTSRVWPGALLMDGEIVGTWRRGGHAVSIRAWRKLSAPQRRSIEGEAASLPLPELGRTLRVTWEER